MVPSLHGGCKLENSYHNETIMVRHVQCFYYQQISMQMSKVPK